LVRALRRANERAWQALEVALAGESLWNRLDRPEERAFRQQVRVFLDAMPLPLLTGKGEFRRLCLRDLRDARGQGLLLGDVPPEELEQTVSSLAPYTDPRALLEAEQAALDGLAGEVERAGFASLAWLLRQPTPSPLPLSPASGERGRGEGGQPLL